MEERKLSCDLAGFKPINVDCDGNVLPVPNFDKPLISMEGKEIPADKLKTMQDYARLLRKKFPHMKQARVTRKVAEHFKIKLV